MSNKISAASQLPEYMEANEGYGYSFKVAFKNAEREWEEAFNLIHFLAKTLAENNIRYKEYEDHLLLLDDMILQPQILSFSARDDGNVSSTTTVQVNSHAQIPAGLFEYQHSIGADLENSLVKGFNNWINSDLKTLLEALTQTENCTSMQMEFPNRTRQMVLGPVTHYGKSQSIEEHSFCPCCFLTNNFETFKSYIESDQVYGIRFFASRSENGEVEADCRINGADFEAGKLALIEYGKTWPGNEFEFRKQYVVVKNKAG